MRRRCLLLFTLFLGGCIGLDDDVLHLVDRARCRLRVGILAETHLKTPSSDRMLEKALRHFKDREVDAIAFVGDVTHAGAIAHRRGAQKVWERVFGPGGGPERIVVTGEEDAAAELSVFLREVKGYSFIGANWKDRQGVDATALKPLLAKMDGKRPFFYLENLIPCDTCCPREGRLGVCEGGKIAYLLSKHPEAVAISSRSHTPLTDESAFWRGSFACVNAGSFAYAKGRGEKGEVQKDSHHGLVMSVYDSSIVFERIDFGREAKQAERRGVHVEKLGTDWVVPWPPAPPAQRDVAAPRFWDDTRLMIIPSERIVSVRFPPVLAKHTGTRAYEYEVTADGAGARRISKTVVSPAWCASEDRETLPVTCDFERSELPAGEVRFEVTPIDSFGSRGRPVSGTTQL